MNKNSLKKLLFLCLAIPFAAVALWGCSRNDRPSDTGEHKLKVVTTLFPYYDFTRQVAGDKVELTMVVPAGMDSHSFEPTPADVQIIREADVLICNGGALEHWLSQVLNAVDSGSITVITGMDYVNTVQEELVEGMEEEEHLHQEDGDDHDGEIEYDEHIWTSPVNAMTLVEAIRDTLTEKDPENRSYYEERAKAYLDKLKKLDGEFCRVAENKKRDMIVVGDKFPFRYLADEYGLSYRAAFSGCSTDTEPSARTIAYLIDKMRLEQIPVIYYLELSSHRVSEIIAEETGAEPLLLHSCHNVSRREFDSGITYLDLMEQNVINLTRGLDE
ncbi:metal ABC transporter substrate-binding protein [Lacrimispora sp. BS-2]|uniref:Metal ABC transporter substrate-binding protein n=1 Tax=Lacrimispora sp. BS-2 TaxID=3151850 RepID=A0AAU7PTL4_9FIRM